MNFLVVKGSSSCVKLFKIWNGKRALFSSTYRSFMLASLSITSAVQNLQIPPPKHQFIYFLLPEIPRSLGGLLVLHWTWGTQSADPLRISGSDVFSGVLEKIQLPVLTARRWRLPRSPGIHHQSTLGFHSDRFHPAYHSRSPRKRRNFRHLKRHHLWSYKNECSQDCRDRLLYGFGFAFSHPNVGVSISRRKGTQFYTYLMNAMNAMKYLRNATYRKYWKNLN